MPVKVRCPNPACGKSILVTGDRPAAACPHCRTRLRTAASTDRPIPLPGSARTTAGGYPVAQGANAPGPTLGDGGPAASASMPAHIGRFQIRSALGVGAFGTVYRAFDPQLEREVALKVPHAGTLDSPKSVERFLREAKAAARLRHPHIVPVFDTGRDGNLLYIASAFIEGSTLSRVIDDGVPFTRAAQIVHDLAEALAYAHHLGIVHRDVKPANIMVDLQGEAHLMDFGLAHRQDSGEKLTQDGAILGTPAYMAPEHAQGATGTVQPASDQYSLGVILYELLCGQTPFSGPPQIVLFNAVHTEPPTPRSLKPHVPRDLETICLKAMAKRAEDRYAGCAELAEDLRRWLALEPIQARRMAAPERLLRWCKREPALAVTILAVAACLVVVALVSMWAAASQATSAENESLARQEADDKKEEAERALAAAEDARKEAERERKNAETAAELAKKKERETADALAEVKRANNDRSAALEEGEKLRLKARVAQADADANAYRYINFIARADHELAANRFDLAERFLDSCAADARRWEWYYLKRRCGAGCVAVGGGSLAFSRDGSMLATAMKNVADRGRHWIGVGSWVSNFADRVVGTPPHWSPRTLTIIAAGKNFPVLDFSPNGAHLAVGFENGGAVYEVASGKIRYPLRSDGDLHSVAYSPDGGTLAAGLHRKVTLWNPADGKHITDLPGHSGQVSALAFDPQAFFLASASNNGNLVVVWRLTQNKVWSTPVSAPTGIAFSPDGKLLACVTRDGTMRLWESDTLRDLGSIKLHDRATHGISLSPDGRRFAVGCSDGTVRVWDLAERHELYALEMHSQPVTAVAWSPDGKRIASVASGLVRVWNAKPLPEGKPVNISPIERRPKTSVQQAMPITALAFSPDSNRLAIGFSWINPKAPAWPGVAASLAYRQKGDNGELAVSLLSKVQVIDLAGKTVLDKRLRTSDARAARLVDLQGGADQLIWQAPENPFGAVPGAGKKMAGTATRIRLVRFTSDGKHAAVLAGRNKNGQEIINVDRVDPLDTLWTTSVGGWVRDIEISRDGKRVLVCRDHQDMQYWDIPNLQPTSLRRPARHAVFSPDGKRLASIDYDDSVTIWDLDKGNAPEPALPGLKCTTLAFSPDGSRLATASEDRTVRIWDTATRQEVLTLRGHRAAVIQVAFSPDGRRLASADADGTIMFWDGLAQ